MAWFGDSLPSLSNLKGQITSFTKEVLSDGIVEELDDRAKQLREANERYVQLQTLLDSKDTEISFLRRQNCELQRTIVELKSKDDLNQDKNGEVFFWDPIPLKDYDSKSEDRQSSHIRSSQTAMKMRSSDTEGKCIQVNNSKGDIMKEEIPDGSQKAELLRVKQDMMNRIIQMEEKGQDLERNTKRVQSDETTLVNDFRTVISKLNAPEKLYLIESALKALQMENEGKSWDIATSKEQRSNFDEKLRKTNENFNTNGTFNKTELLNNKEVELSKKIIELQEENKNLVFSMEELDRQNSESIEKLLSLKEEIEEKHQCLQNTYKQLYADYDNAQSKIVELESKLASKKTNEYSIQTESVKCKEKDIQTEDPISQDTKDIRKKENENYVERIRTIEQKVKEMLNANHLKTDEGESVFEIMLNEYLEMKWKKDLLEKKITEITRDLKDTTEIKDNLQMECDDMQANIDSLLFDIEHLKSNLPSIPEASEECIESLEVETESLQDEVKRLMEELTTLRNAKNNLERENENLIEKNEKLKAELSEYDEMKLQKKDDDLLAHLQEQLSNIQMERDDLRKELDDALNKIDDKESAIQKLREECEKLVKKSESSLEQFTAMQGEANGKIESLNVDLLSLQQEYEGLKERMTSNEKEFDEVQDKLKETERSHMLLKDEYMEKQQKLEELRLENDCLRSEMQRISELQESLMEKETVINRLSENIKSMETELDYLHNRRQEVKEIQTDITYHEEIIKDLNDKLQMAEEKCHQLENSLVSFKNETRDAISSRENLFENEKAQIFATLEEKLRENESLKEENTELALKVTDMKNELEDTIESNRETANMAKETIENLSHLVKEKDHEIETLTSENKINTSNSSDLVNIRNERDELVKLVQIKHNESLQYHGEIQRLTRLLNEQASQIQDLLVKQDQNLTSLKHKDVELARLQNELEAVQQRVKQLKESNNNDKVCGIPAHFIQLTEISILKDKCNALEAALIQEQSNSRMLQNQLTESLHKKTNAEKELERLRTHLVEIESSYTEEALIAEEMRKELEMKLSQAEEKMKNSSTAYTSASIRANQQIETLQQQMALIVQQRDDIQNKLSATEDKVIAQTTALTNLQIVLERFQTEKEADIKAATERIQLELRESHRQQEELLNEISYLKDQLTEAKEYVQAASRLSEQLDKKAERIEQLNREVEKLTELVNTADQRIEEAMQSGVGKVDKTLMKNLLLGYLSSSTADKSSVLRVFATVLDFTEVERTKAGLNSASAQNSWFSRFVGDDTKMSTKDQEASLSAAFIRFLESESKPKLQLPALPVSSSSTHRPTHTRQHSTSSTHSTLLLSDVTLPTFPDFVPVRNTGSILKEVLKDSS